MTRIAALRRPAWAMVVALVGLAACSSDNSSSTSRTTTAAEGEQAAARSYCTSKGGTTQTRDATSGTNGAETKWVTLGRSVEMCRFQTLGDNDASRIYVDLHTLYSDRPTLAAVAFLSKITPKATTGANAATAYCAALSGSSQFGTGAAGGGWVDKKDPVDVVVALCMFPDQSFIDEGGLTSYAGGVVRGIDLAKVFRYQATQLPAFFGR